MPRRAKFTERDRRRLDQVGDAIFDATAPVVQASADVAATGTAPAAARRDHVHGMPTLTGLAIPAVALGAAAVAGTATTAVRTDSTIAAFDAVTPVAQAFGDAAAVGTAAFAARRDHRHGMPTRGVIRVRKTADQVVNNSTVLVNDTALLFAMAANEVYVGHIVLFADGTTVADLKVQITVPTGASGRWGGHGLDTAATGSSGSIMVLDSDVGLAIAYGTVGVATRVTVLLYFTVVNGTTAGNLQLQWAQNVADASDLTVRLNSYLVAFLV